MHRYLANNTHYKKGILTKTNTHTHVGARIHTNTHTREGEASYVYQNYPNFEKEGRLTMHFWASGSSVSPGLEYIDVKLVIWQAFSLSLSLSLSHTHTRTHTSSSSSSSTKMLRWESCGWPTRFQVLSSRYCEEVALTASLEPWVTEEPGSWYPAWIAPKARGMAACFSAPSVHCLLLPSSPCCEASLPSGMTL